MRNTCKKGGEKMVLNKEINELEQELEETLPKFVFRNDPAVIKYTGLSARFMANLDSSGKGVKKRVKIGKRVAYPKEALIEFILSRIKEQ